MHDLNTMLSSVIQDLTIEASVPRYLAFCVGLDRERVHMLRNSYASMTSQCSPILKATAPEYEVKIIGFYADKLERVFNTLGLTPNVIIVGPSFKGPYPQFVKDWLLVKKPSVIRIADDDADPSTLSHDDYYLGVNSVIGFDRLIDSWRISNEIDYNILVNLNYRRTVKIEDYDHHIVSLDDIDIESTFDASSLRDSSFFTKEAMASAAADFFNDRT